MPAHSHVVLTDPLQQINRSRQFQGRLRQDSPLQGHLQLSSLLPRQANHLVRLQDLRLLADRLRQDLHQEMLLSTDLLRISLLQQSRQLTIIARSIEKKIKEAIKQYEAASSKAEELPVAAEEQPIEGA